MPDEHGSDGARLLRLERESARDSQRLAELERRVDALTPLLTSVVTLTVEFKNMREDLSGFMKRVEERDADRDKDRVVSRRWLIGLAAGLLFALIGAAAVIASVHS